MSPASTSSRTAVDLWARPPRRCQGGEEGDIAIPAGARLRRDVQLDGRSPALRRAIALAELSPEEPGLQQAANIVRIGITSRLRRTIRHERIIRTICAAHLTAADLARLEAGLKQRVAALTGSARHRQQGRGLKDGLVPRSMVRREALPREMRGLACARRLLNVCGSDLVGARTECSSC